MSVILIIGEACQQFTNGYSYFIYTGCFNTLHSCTTCILNLSLENSFCGFFNPLTPVQPVTNLGLSSTSYVITFDQNWHHLYSTSAGGKDLSNDAQIRVIGRMEP